MAIYLKLGDVKGDVTHEGYQDWIECHSFQFGVGRGIGTPVGAAANREASAPSISEVTLTKAMDGSSTEIMKQSLSGAEGVKVEIALVGTGDPATEICRYQFDKSLISGYSVTSGGDRPSESLSINFTKVEYSMTELDAANKTGTPVRVTYDLATAKKG